MPLGSGNKITRATPRAIVQPLHHHHNLYFDTIKIKAKKLVGSCITYKHIDILNLKKIQIRII